MKDFQKEEVLASITEELATSVSSGSSGMSTVQILRDSTQKYPSRFQNLRFS